MKKRIKIRPCSICALLIFTMGLVLIVTKQAISQDSLNTHQPKIRFDTLPNIFFNGFINGSTELRVRVLELVTVPMVNIQSAEKIEKSTDITVADVAQRISAVTVTKNNIGLSDKTLIRGIDPKYNYSLVNGLLLPSPNDRERYISLSLFPSVMVSRVEVYKTLTADMEGGAIGGAVNIVMKDAPNQMLMEIQMSTGYNGIYFSRGFEEFNNHVVSKKSPEEIHGQQYYATVNDFTKDNLSFHDRAPLPNGYLNATIGKRFLDKKLGVVFSFSYQNQKKGSNGFFIPQNAEPQLNNLPNLTDFIIRHYDEELINYGVQNKWDYTIDSRNKISFFQMFNQKTDIETRFSTDTNLVQGRSIPGTGRVTQYQRSRMHIQDLYCDQLQGMHLFSPFLSLKYEIAYALAKGLYPDWAELTFNNASLLQPNGSIAETPLILSPFTRTWLRNKEQDLTFSPNLEYKKTIHKQAFRFLMGAFFRQKWRDNFYNAYYFTPALTSSVGQPFIDIHHAQWLNNEPQNPLGAVGSSNSFNASEQIKAAFFQTNFKLKKLDITAGIRWENTEQQINTSINPLPGVGQKVGIYYNDWLPSLHLAYPFSPRLQLKGSYFKGITRPALYDLSFYNISYEDASVVGNPFLNRAKADNLDLRADYELNTTNYLQGGLFYKSINNPFEKALLNVNDELYPIASPGLTYTPATELTEQVRNFGNAKVLGFEMAGSFTVNRFTISANYTFTYSHIVQVKKYETRETPGNNNSNIITVSKTESRPLQGQSPHNGNLNISYKNDKIGFQTQLAFVYTGKRIYSVSGWYGLDYWQTGIIQSDFSVQQKLGSHWQLFATAPNIFRSNMRVFIHQQNSDWGIGLLLGQISPNKILVQQDYYYASFSIGIKYKFKN